MVSRKRSQRLEKLAQLYDGEILPVWSERFGRMLLRDLPLPEKGQILDVACGTGYPAVEIIRRMNQDTRLIAIDPVSAMLDEARKKVEAMGAKGVFFRTESAEPKLSFANDVYDLVVCNLGLVDFDDPAIAIADFARVTRPGGHVRCTLPIEGTFQEFYDIFREVLTKHDKHKTLEELDSHLESYPDADRCESWLRSAPLANVDVSVDEFTMLFRSSREFFFAPVIEYGPLATWKGIAGRGQEMQDIFWYIKEAIDAYFEGRAFEVTVRAACLSGTKPDEDTALITDRLEVRASEPIAALVEDLGTGEISISFDDDEDDEDDDENEVDSLPTGSIDSIDDGTDSIGDETDSIGDETDCRDGTEEELAVLPESEGLGDETEEPETLERGEPVSRNPAASDSMEEAPLDAFVEGAERPLHLASSDPE